MCSSNANDSLWVHAGCPLVALWMCLLQARAESPHLVALRNGLPLRPVVAAGVEVRLPGVHQLRDQRRGEPGGERQRQMRCWRLSPWCDSVLRSSRCSSIRAFLMPDGLGRRVPRARLTAGALPDEFDFAELVLRSGDSREARTASAKRVGSAVQCGAVPGRA